MGGQQTKCCTAAGTNAADVDGAAEASLSTDDKAVSAQAVNAEQAQEDVEQIARQRAEEEAQLKEAAEAEARRQAEEEQARLLEEAKKKEEEEARQKAEAEAEAEKKRLAEEKAAKEAIEAKEAKAKKKEAEEAKRKKKMEEEAARKKEEARIKKLLSNAGKHLCKAAKGNDGKKTKELLDAKADPNSNSLADPNDADGRSPLQVASEHGSVDVVKLLLGAQADVGKLVPVKRDSSLHLAAMGGHLQVVQLLVEAGANTTHKNDFGQDAATAAEGKGQSGIVAFLRKK